MAYFQKISQFMASFLAYVMLCGFLFMIKGKRISGQMMPILKSNLIFPLIAAEGAVVGLITGYCRLLVGDF